MGTGPMRAFRIIGGKKRSISFRWWRLRLDEQVANDRIGTGRGRDVAVMACGTGPVRTMLRRPRNLTKSSGNPKMISRKAAAPGPCRVTTPTDTAAHTRLFFEFYSHGSNVVSLYQPSKQCAVRLKLPQRPTDQAPVTIRNVSSSNDPGETRGQSGAHRSRSTK
jgi:hypothetical protein